MRSFFPFLLLFVFISGSLFSAAAQAAGKASAPATKSAKSAASAGIGNNASGASPAEMPVTVKMRGDTDKPGDTDPIFGMAPLPKGKTTLVGGTVSKIDGVRDRLKVKVFDGGTWTVSFDERTHFYLNGTETTFDKVKKGQRVYVDTMLDHQHIFARNVHIVTKTGPALARGQVIAMDGNTMEIRDELSSEPVRFRMDGGTQIRHNGTAVSRRDLQPGSLITVRFSPGQKANRGVAREVTILAVPGQSVTFAGKVMNLDLSKNVVSVANTVDNKTYDIEFDGQKVPRNLMVGSEVTVAAVFNGGGYKARNIRVVKR